MEKYSLKNDYSEGAHPRILQALIASNKDQEEGYGLDSHSQRAAQLIQEQVDDPKAAVFLLSGGTQTNLIAISTFLRPHEACISARTGHIATHETGAIEATGHKLLTVDSTDGKLRPELIKPILAEHHFEHMVRPRMVYISNPTELGTVYSHSELSRLSSFCKENDLYLYLDGARLGSAITCAKSDLDFKKVHSLADAFFIGGTKNGTLLGEALVIRTDELKKDFRYFIKQRGGLLAKGRILGIQFEELFQNNLYLELAFQANTAAQKLAAGLAAKGCTFLIDSPTNQIFPILDNNVIATLKQYFDFYVWQKIDDNRSAVRLVTSWATEKKKLDLFLEIFEKATELKEK